MTMSITLAITLKTPSSSATTGAALSGATSVSAAPKTIEKNIRPIMSGVDRAIDSRGLLGTSVRTNDSIGDSACPTRLLPAATHLRRTVSGADRVSRDRAAYPACTVFARISPSATETREMTRQYATVRAPTRPSRRTSPIPATPTIRDETTSGTTVINSARRKS